MNDMIEFLTSKEIIVVYIVIAVALFLCFLIFLIDRNNDKRKQRENTKKLNKLVEEVNSRLQEEAEEDRRRVKISKKKAKSVKEEIIENNKSTERITSDIDFVPPVNNSNNEEKPKIEEVYVNNIAALDDTSMSFEDKMDSQINKVHESIEGLAYTSPEPDREEATRELLRLTEELERAEKAQKTGIDILAYENEQEENAIISLDELTKRGDEMYASNEVTQYADEGNEPISLADLEKRKAQVINSEVVEPEKKATTIVEEKIQTSMLVEELKEEKVTKVSGPKTEIQIQNGEHAYQGAREKTNEIFSSVFGNVSPKADTVQTEEELQKTSEFLLSLKDLQSRLNS